MIFIAFPVALHGGYSIRNIRTFKSAGDTPFSATLCLRGEPIAAVSCGLPPSTPQLMALNASLPVDAAVSKGIGEWLTVLNGEHGVNLSEHRFLSMLYWFYSAFLEETHRMRQSCLFRVETGESATWEEFPAPYNPVVAARIRTKHPESDVTVMGELIDAVRADIDSAQEKAKPRPLSFLQAANE